MWGLPLSKTLCASLRYIYIGFWDPVMRLVIAATCFLLLLSTEVEGKAVSKRHVRRDWLIIPDTVAFYVYEAVNKVSPEAGKSLMDLFEKPLVQDTRGYLIKKTSELTVKAEELYQNISDFLNKKSKE
ncbi:apovitellenin-1-like isoform X2 [Ranitomeya variabilis]|uniref:apovitellenin-1-like isoform X2 n=1 Tax=Ranitomeya variabilis TaxID=490064 RepID=UPI004055DF8E